MIHGQIISAVLCTALLTGCQTTTGKMEQGVARRGTPSYYIERWDEVETKEGKAPKAFKRLYAEVLKELNATQFELAKERK